ncbi:MAG TPA: DUF2231 domain-containing protein [Candidatus Limnocylindrales bacterium]|nr:DUF2231 domain-containing protein [Candidatus Limnocylindrales bacterium]
MQDQELGLDRTVAASWAPDDTWPTFSEGVGGIADELGAHTADAPPAAPLTGGPDAGEIMDPAVASDDGIDDGFTDDLEPDGPPAVEAVAAIEGHPLHPAIVPLPIGSFVGAFLCDLAYLRTKDRFWARGARILTGAGLVTGAIAGSLGAIDFTGRREIRSHKSAWVHAGGNLTVMALGLVSEVIRAKDERTAVARGALAISAVSAAILGVTGWIGGELSYRERIGVTTS